MEWHKICRDHSKYSWTNGFICARTGNCAEWIKFIDINSLSWVRNGEHQRFKWLPQVEGDINGAK